MTTSNFKPDPEMSALIDKWGHRVSTAFARSGYPKRREDDYPTPKDPHQLELDLY